MHGSYAGWKAHENAGTAACAACRTARNRYAQSRKLGRLEGSQVLVPGVAVSRAVQGLMRNGFAAHHLAARLGVSRRQVRKWVGAQRVRPATEARVLALWAELRNVRGPSSQAASNGVREGWVPAWAWDRDTIRNPFADWPPGRRVE